MVLKAERFEEIQERLLSAFVEEKDDVVTLMTIIDLYLEEVNLKGTKAQKTVLLSQFLGLLQQNKELVYEIGWDVPKILIKYVHWSNYNYVLAGASKDVLSLVMNSLAEIALFGNPKECFFAGCQLLSDLKINDDGLLRFVVEEEPIMDPEDDSGEETFTEDNVEDNHENSPSKPSSEDESDELEPQLPDLQAGLEFYGRQPQELIMDLRFHCIIELIGTAMKRITTLYPSKFLGEVVQSIIKFNTKNAPDLDDPVFILRRIYSFIRGYIPPAPPSDMSENITEDELKEIGSSEESLQRSLICFLLTSSVKELTRFKGLSTLTSYTQRLQMKEEEVSVFDYSMTLQEMLIRYYQLAISSDIDVPGEFERLCIDESRQIYHSLPKDSDIKSDEELKELTNFVYQLAYTYELEKVANVKEILIDPAGILTLQLFAGDQKFLPPNDVKINVDDAIYMYLRFVTPSMFSSVFESQSIQESVRTWLLYALTNNSVQESVESLKKIPTYLVTIYLQVELSLGCNIVDLNRRKMVLSVLTRILCLMPEDFSFDFIKDTLITCPYRHAKCCILSILKDMMTRERKATANVETEKLVDEMAALNLKKSPPLPSRPFILLNEDRIASLHSCALLTINAYKENPDGTNLKSLLIFVRFLESFAGKWDAVLLKEICDKVTTDVISGAKSDDNNNSQLSVISDVIASIASRLSSEQK